MGIEAFRSMESLGKINGKEHVRLCLEMEAAPSQWIHVCPYGPVVKASDGRQFRISNPWSVLASTRVPLLVDLEHSSIHGSTIAYGWITELRVQPTDVGEFSRAGFWGRAEWTPDGHNLIRTKAYRFFSPTAILSGEDRDLSHFESVALTNLPALDLQAADAYRQKFSLQYADRGPKDSKIDRVALRAKGLSDSLIDAALALGTRPTAQTRKASESEIRAALRAQGVLSDDLITAALALKPYGRP